LAQGEAILRSTAVVCIALTASLLGWVPPAHATLQFALQSGGTTFFCADNTACDTNPAVGIIQINNQTLAGLQINGSIQTAVSSRGLDLLSASSLSIVNATRRAITAQATISATDFMGPVSSIETTGSGTWVGARGSSTTLRWFEDPLNRQGAAFAGDTPGDLVDTFTSTATRPGQSFAHDNVETVSDTGPFSMTLDTAGTLRAGGSLLNRGQAAIANFIPEPGPLSLLGVGLGLIGLDVRRRRQTLKRRSC
jgi:hypothetical protein